MPDDTNANPAPADTPIPQVPEALNSTPSEVIIASVPAEAPTEPISSPEPIPDEPTAQMGGNEPFEPAPIESVPPVPTIETPVAVTEPVPTEILAPEVVPTETTQPTPAEPVIETVPETITVETSTPVQAPTEATPAAQVETPATTPISVPVAQTTNTAPTSEPTPAPVATSTPIPAQVVATVVAPVIATTITQPFTKSIRELFTKAQLAIQNRKNKKLNRIMSLFARQTTITNNEVEKLLHVSDSTATRYLTTLTKEGKLKQNTKKGHAVSYSKI